MPPHSYSYFNPPINNIWEFATFISTSNLIYLEKVGFYKNFEYQLLSRVWYIVVTNITLLDFVG